jgi:hypothetical protein
VVTQHLVYFNFKKKKKFLPPNKSNFLLVILNLDLI